MDVLLTSEARREIEALAALRPKAGAWGAVIGRRRGPRFIVEKITLAGSPGTVPDGRALAGLDGVWPGRIIGLSVVKPGTAFRKAVLGPAWFGKLVLRWSGGFGAPALQAAVVGFERKFSLEPVPFAPDAKEKTHE